MLNLPPRCHWAMASWGAAQDLRVTDQGVVILLSTARPRGSSAPPPYLLVALVARTRKLRKPVGYQILGPNSPPKKGKCCRILKILVLAAGNRLRVRDPSQALDSRPDLPTPGSPK